MRDLAEVGETIFALKDVEARRAFLRTLRGVVDSRPGGDALDRLYLAHAVPMLVIWGRRRSCGAAAETVREMVPGARVEVFDGHWAHLDDPKRFCDVLLDFLATTEAAAHDRDSWRALLAQEPLGTS